MAASMDRAISTTTLQDLASPDYTAADLLALKETIAKDCDLSQLRVFVMAARRLGLDPFARQIVPIVQGGKMTPQVTIDGFRLISERTGKYAGILGPFWCGEDGTWRDVWLSSEPPVAAKVGILRRDFEQPVWGVARTAAYRSGTPTWQKMPDVMIAKVAESLARRIAFPQELGGVYTDDEMAQAHEDDRRAPITPIAHAGRTVDASTGEVLSAPAAASKPAREDPWAEVRDLSGKLNLSDEARADLFTRHRKDRNKILDELRQKLKKAEDDAEAITFEVMAASSDNGDPDLLRNHPALQGSVRP